MAVLIDWLATLLSRLRHKDPNLVIKKMMDGFFNPWDLAKIGGTANLYLHSVLCIFNVTGHWAQ